MEAIALVMFNQTVKYENDNIWVKPVCDFFNLHVKNQHAKIKKDLILGKLVGKNRPDLGEIDNNGRILLSKKGFLRWIQIINPNTIDPKLQPSFLLYQELIFDYLIGSGEEQKMIGNLNAKLQDLKMDYSALGNEIRTTQKALFAALNRRYQYSLPFEAQKEIQ